MDVAPPASRNSPCPCGSGRRYKDCHGALGTGGAAPVAPGTPTSAPRTSSYRAPASEWQGVSENEADRLGGIMERALAHQLAGRSDAAARLYREVLDAAPRTHDALHMLGVVELGAGNPEEAERLIGEALALRPAYPTITHNLQLVQDALAARHRALPEELCERALPLLYELALAPAGQAPVATHHDAGGATVHLIGRAGEPGSDEGWLLRRLAALLAPVRPTLWATDALPVANVDGARAIGIDAASGFVPQGGVHVFAGIELPDLEWIERAEADRVIVVCTPARPSLYLDQLRAIGRDGTRPVELVFTHPGLAARFGGVGTVLPLPLELPAATGPRDAAPVAFGSWSIERPPPFVAGVVGQMGGEVEEAWAVEFLTRVARRAGGLAVYDPGRLRYPLGGDPSVRCLARASGAFAAFLASVDCFVHRSRRWWHEGDGRALSAAMASGIPVLCPRDSLFAAEIRDGVDGLLYSDDEHALEMIGELHRAPAWARALGAAARAHSAERFDAGTLASQYRAAILGAMPRRAIEHGAARLRVA